MNGKSRIRTAGEFWRDTADCWQRLPNKTFFFALLAAWLLLFQFLGNSVFGYVHTPSLFSWMYSCYNTPNAATDDGHGNLIPFLVLGLFWWKRHELLESPLQIWRPGLLILIVGMALQLLSSMLQLPQFSILAMFIGIYGLMGLAWGPKWLLKSSFPFFLFIFSIPLGTHATVITFPLRLLVSRLVEMVAHLFGIDVIRIGTQLMDPSGNFQYDVAPACSGIRSLIANFLLATVYGFLTFREGWKRLFFMALALPFAVLGNLLRLLMVIVAATIGGQSWGNSVHDSTLASLMPYVPAFVGLLLIGRWMETPEQKEQEI